MGDKANRPHPIQDVVIDERGVQRFRENVIVRRLLDEGGIDLNQIAMWDVSREDREQFAQLIGYSLSGAHDLSYVSDECLALAEAKGEGKELDRADYLREKILSIRRKLTDGLGELYGLHPDNFEFEGHAP